MAMTLTFHLNNADKHAKFDDLDLTITVDPV